MTRGSPLMILASLGLISGCSASAEVMRTVDPSQIGRMTEGNKMHMTAIVRKEERIAIPEGAIIESDRIVIRGGGIVTESLHTGDILQSNRKGEIVGIKGRVQFVPGTAESPPGANYVRGRVAGAEKGIPLRGGDKIEVTGTFETGDSIPGGGSVEKKRFTFGLALGTAMVLTAWLPTLYAGVESSKSYDRTLVIPILGPWIDLASRAGCGAQPTADDDALVQAYAACKVSEDPIKAALVTSGAIQGVGLVLILIGAPVSAEIVDDPKGVSMRVGPDWHAGGNGLSLTGTF